MLMNRFKKEKYIPDIFSNVENWKVDRRKFVKALSVTTVLSQMGTISGCTNSNTKKYQANQFLTTLQSEIIQKIQAILFPDDGNGPSVTEIKAFEHILWVLSDNHKDNESKDYIINGMTWCEEVSQEKFGRIFSDLTQIETEALVKYMTTTNWGKSWLSIILTLIFEALALDPIYMINTNQVGWQWLSHVPGNPRANENNSYPKIFKTIHEN